VSAIENRRPSEHHHREEAGHESTRARVTGEEALQVARHAVVVPEQKPGDVVDDVVQSRDDQHPVQYTVGE